MPEYANWIQNMISKGHTILLVGKDLEEIQHSYKYPLTYWKNHSRAELRSLWLVALATKMYKDSVGDPDFLVATDENGDVFELPRTTETYLRHFHWGGGCENILCYPSSLSMSYNLPPPLSWTDCAYDMMKKRSWCTLPRTMDSDISLVYLPNYCRDEVLFDESTEASEPYFSAIFGSADPFYEPTNVPYIQMVDGERKLDSNLGISLDPSQVRLHPTRDDPYRWLVSPGKEYLFAKNLSDQSVGVYKELCDGVNTYFEATQAPLSPLPEPLGKESFGSINKSTISFTSRINELQVQKDYASQEVHLLRSQLEAEVKLRLSLEEKIQVAHERQEGLKQELQKLARRENYYRNAALTYSQGIAKVLPTLTELTEKTYFLDTDFI
ncbi:hypothetical protein CDV31_014733 [Fusarium ambrosium]|uniref:Uncharacterized protein n=1 Tax=Fusarium ambrosium TaxID=131363 RepID=A0A428SUB6_9HYPO|nr:hypothetical protein CDV31_014733 [Fusarium ambrosium]